jgi:hypothetical protein
VRSSPNCPFYCESKQSEHSLFVTSSCYPHTCLPYHRQPSECQDQLLVWRLFVTRDQPPAHDFFLPLNFISFQFRDIFHTSLLENPF